MFGPMITPISGSGPAPGHIAPGHARSLQLRAARIEALAAKLQEALPKDQPITLELGCGHGHFLTAYAMAHPAEFCLGADISTKRVVKAMAKRNKRNLNALLFLKAEVSELLAAWPAGRPVQRVFCLFPDPWPKKRHRKNRVVQAALLSRLAVISDAGACFHFRSDHPVALEWAREQIVAHPLWDLDPASPWPFENPSFFQDLAPAFESFSARRTCLP